MVYLFLAPGFEESEAVVPADLLRRAGVEVTLVGLDGRQVVSSHNITVTADLTLEELDREQVDMLMLPGGLGGVEAISSNIHAQALLQYCYDHGRWLAAICAAPTILANLGMLDRRKAVCYPGMEGDLVKAGVEPCMTEPFVVEGHLITGRAAGSSFDFGLALLTALSGADVARQVQNAIHYMA